MSRNLKALGLALIAVVALSAMAASAAQANNITSTTGVYPVTLTGTDLAVNHGELARLTIGPKNSRFVECTSASLSATITKETTTVEVEPAFSNCFSNGLTGVPATVTMNGCTLLLTAISTTTGTAELKCPVGKEVQIHVYSSAENHTKGIELCTYDIAAQKPEGDAVIDHQNIGTHTEDLILTGKFTGVKVTNTVGNAVNCNIAAGGSTTATLGGNYTVTGETDKLEGNTHLPVMI